MDALDREADAQRRNPRDVEQVAGRLHQQRAQPLAPAHGGMAHRLVQARARILGNRQQQVEQPVDVGRHRRSAASHQADRRGQDGVGSAHGRLSRTLHAQSEPKGWAPVTAPLASMVSLAIRASAA